MLHQLCRRPVTVAEAEAIAGTLSRPSKMPCRGYSIPAAACHAGSKLVNIPGSTCHSCYALKGRYRMPNVKRMLAFRLQSLTHPWWTAAMILLIARQRSGWFRWHDAGDLQSLQHLLNIMAIAAALPEIRFWLPTREVALVRQAGPMPPNLTVRVSATMVDGPLPSSLLTSSVVTSEANVTCPAHHQAMHCGDCRQCWDPTVKNVSYLKH
jgi:hypothetical protein